MLPFKKILVAIDALEEHQWVLDQAARLAEKHAGSLLIVDGVPEINWAQRWVLSGAEHMQELLLREKGQRLRKLASALRKRGIDVKTKLLVGRTADEIIRQVMRGKHDLVMRAAKGPHSRRPDFFSSTGFELLRKCPCAVMLCKSAAPVPHGRIVAAVDPHPEKEAYRELDRRIVEAAVQLGQFGNAPVDILHIWSVYGERMVKDYMKANEFQELEKSILSQHTEALNQLLTSSGWNGPAEHVHVQRGEATVEIPKYAADSQAELLVMGTVARGGVSGLVMGNTAELILHQLKCSVLALKPAGFVTPVKLRAAKEAEASEPEVGDLPETLPMPPVP